MEKMSTCFIFLLVLLPQCFMVSLAVSLKNIITDKSAFVEIKAHITFDPDNIISSNWSSATSVCSWVGVSCGVRHHRVTALNLSKMNLSGSLPPHLGNLSFLASFNLSGNNFQGQLPPELGKLRRLKRLDLSYNLLEGNIPRDLCDHWTRLELLHLHTNQLNGSIPPGIGNCRKLQNLALRRNRFTGYIPRSIGNLTELTTIYLDHNDLEGEIPVEVGNLLKLEILSIVEVGLQGFVPPTIFNISSMKEIYLANNSLSGSLPFDLCLHLPMLEKLLFYNNKLTGTIPKDIGNCTLLYDLEIDHNNLTGEIPQEMGNLPLSFLDMAGNLFTGSIPPMIFNISTLKVIDLDSSNLSGQLPSTLGLGLPRLTALYLGGNKLSGRLPSSISNASLLVELDLPVNSLSGPLPNSIGDLQFLEWLNLAENNMSTKLSTPQTSILSSLTNCRFLKYLDISYSSLNGFLPDSIGNLSSSLQYLSINDCKLHGNIPIEIGNLSNLILLFLSENDLTGPTPTTIGRLQQLQVIYFYSNKLEGEFPSILCRLDTLSELRLDDNLLTGSIPECISNLTSLRYLHINSNKFSSFIPSTLWSLTYILQVDLSSNGFNGSLPLDVGNLRVLTVMELSGNQFSGNIPSTIGDLASLEFLDLSNNNIFGSIPKSLEALSSLKVLNVSFNKLEGEIPARGSFQNFSAELFAGNDALCGLPRFHVPMCKTTLSQPPKVVRLLKYVLPPIVAAMVLVLVVTIIIRRKQKSKLKATDHEEGFTGPTEWRRISYLELQQATTRFSESHLLGSGCFGSVYNGTLSDGTNIAVKVFNLQVEGALRSFDTECEVLRSIRHRNLIKVISSCSNEDFKALVLEFMPNGTLEKWLHSDGHRLNIIQRLNIMIDVASALEYLHHGYSIPIIHCDLKPSNVLLDEDLVAHVADFGITKLMGNGDSITQTMRIAIVGYMAPEYGSLGIVSAKGDVYSYGILLMETFTKRKPIDELFDEEMILKLWVEDSLSSSVVEVMDANLVEERHLFAITSCVSSVLELAVDCCAEVPKERKNMKDVVTILIKIKKKYLKDTRRIR